MCPCWRPRRLHPCRRYCSSPRYILRQFERALFYFFDCPLLNIIRKLSFSSFCDKLTFTSHFKQFSPLIPFLFCLFYGTLELSISLSDFFCLPLSVTYPLFFIFFLPRLDDFGILVTYLMSDPGIGRPSANDISSNVLILPGKSQFPAK
jgi:hypothetical protein